jgi:hypothetical protein
MPRVVIHRRDAIKVDKIYVDPSQNPFGNSWWANFDTGAAGYNGTDPAVPFATNALAVAAAATGDAIYLRGTAFNEAVSVAKAGLRFIGMGSNPNECVWTAPNDTVCAIITAQNVLFRGIRFRPPAYNATVGSTCKVVNGTGTMTGSPVTLALGANTPTITVAGTFTVTLPYGCTATVATGGWTVTGSPVACAAGTSTSFTAEAGGSSTVTITVTANPAAIQLGVATNNVAAYCRIQKCRFQGKTGSYIAIYAPVPTDNVRVEECEFFYLNNITTVYGTAILGVQDASYNAFSSWVIRGNEFKAPVQGIKLAGRGCIIENNNFAVNGLLAAGTMGAVTGSAGSKKMIDLRGNGHEAGCNDVHGNYLGGAYNNTLYFQGYSDDDWSGNFNIAGITTALPTT